MYMSNSQFREKSMNNSLSRFKESFSILDKVQKNLEDIGSSDSVLKTIGTVSSYFKSYAKTNEQQNKSLDMSKGGIFQETSHKQGLGVIIGERLILTSASNLVKIGRTHTRVNNRAYFYLRSDSKKLTTASMVGSSTVKIKVSQFKLNPKFLKNPLQYKNTKQDYAILVLEERAKKYIRWEHDFNNVIDIKWNSKIKVGKKNTYIVYRREGDTLEGGHLKIRPFTQKSIEKIPENIMKSGFLPIITQQKSTKLFKLVGFFIKNIEKIPPSQDLQDIIDFESDVEQNQATHKIISFKCNLIGKKPFGQLQQPSQNGISNGFLQISQFQQILHQISVLFPSVVIPILPQNRQSNLYLNQLLRQSNREVVIRREEIKSLQQTLLQQRKFLSAFMEGNGIQQKTLMNMQEQSDEESNEQLYIPNRNTNMLAKQIQNSLNSSDDSISDIEVEPNSQHIIKTQKKHLSETNIHGIDAVPSSQIIQKKKDVNKNLIPNTYVKRNTKKKQQVVKTKFKPENLLNKNLIIVVLVLIVGFLSLPIMEAGFKGAIINLKNTIEQWETPKTEEKPQTSHDISDKEQVVPTKVNVQPKIQIQPKVQVEPKVEVEQKVEEQIMQKDQPESSLPTKQPRQPHKQPQMDMDSNAIHKAKQLKKFMHKIVTPPHRAEANPKTYIQLHLGDNRVKNHYYTWRQQIEGRTGSRSLGRQRHIIQILTSIADNYNCQSVKYLDVRQNKLNDKDLQRFFSLSYLPNLQTLFVDGNSLQGTKWLFPTQNSLLQTGVNPSQIKSLGLGHNQLTQDAVGAFLSYEWTKLQTLTLSFKQGRNDMGWRLFLMNVNRWKNLPNLNSLSIFFSQELSQHSKRNLLTYKDNHPLKPIITWYDRSGSQVLGENQQYPQTIEPVHPSHKAMHASQEKAKENGDVKNNNTNTKVNTNSHIDNEKKVEPTAAQKNNKIKIQRQDKMYQQQQKRKNKAKEEASTKKEDTKEPVQKPNSPSTQNVSAKAQEQQHQKNAADLAEQAKTKQNKKSIQQAKQEQVKEKNIPEKVQPVPKNQKNIKNNQTDKLDPNSIDQSQFVQTNKMKDITQEKKQQANQNKKVQIPPKPVKPQTAKSTPASVQNARNNRNAQRGKNTRTAVNANKKVVPPKPATQPVKTPEVKPTEKQQQKDIKVNVDQQGNKKVQPQETKNNNNNENMINKDVNNNIIEDNNQDASIGQKQGTQAANNKEQTHKKQQTKEQVKPNDSKVTQKQKLQEKIVPKVEEAKKQAQQIKKPIPTTNTASQPKPKVTPKPTARTNTAKPKVNTRPAPNKARVQPIKAKPIPPMNNTVGDKNGIKKPQVPTKPEQEIKKTLIQQQEKKKQQQIIANQKLKEQLKKKESEKQEPIVRPIKQDVVNQQLSDKQKANQANPNIPPNIKKTVPKKPAPRKNIMGNNRRTTNQRARAL